MSRLHSFDVRQFVANPAAPTVTPQGTPGSTAYGYKVVALGTGGRKTAAGSAGSTASGAAAMDETDFNRVTWTAVDGAQGYEVHRTVGGETQGLIGTTAAGDESFDDTGLVADGSTASAANNTGVGDPTETLTQRDKTVQVAGTFVASLKIQGTVDGANWVDEGSAITAPAIAEVSKTYQAMRIVETAYTSGTPVATMASHHGD